MSNVNEKDFQVVITKPIFLGGRIWDPNVYFNPQTILVDCAKDEYQKENPVVYFSKDGVKFDPFSNLTMVGDVPPENDEDDLDDEEEVETEEDENIDNDDVQDNNLDDGEDIFLSTDDFASLSKTKQLKYIEDIKNTPDELEGELVEEYENSLYVVLSEYSKIATSSKAIELIEEILALYN